MTFYSRKLNPYGLRQECLSYPEILAQSIGNIAPTMIASVNIALVFGTAGNGTWLAFLIATVGVVLVSLCIKPFARLSASAGSLYVYIGRSLGPTTGVISGWALVLAYAFTAMAMLGSCSLYTNLVLSVFSLHISPIILFAICASLTWYYAYTDIQLSAVLMLLLEFSSVILIVILALIVLFGHGFTIDTAQLSLDSVSADGIRLGMVLAVFGYVGFESSTTLGIEAKNPLKAIPTSVIWSSVLCGLFYILIAYTQVLAFRGYATPLNKVDGPLSVIAHMVGVEWLGVAISVAIVMSGFSCILASLNAAARVCFSLGRHGILHSSVGQAHLENETPHIAISILSMLIFLVPASMSMFGISELDIYGYLATIATYGFLLVYLLIAVAAPIYLSRKRRLSLGNLAVAIVAVIFMLIPIIGSLYPVPAFPYNVFPYLFLMYLAVGAGFLWLLRQRSPQTIDSMQRDLEAVERKFSTAD